MKRVASGERTRVRENRESQADETDDAQNECSEDLRGFSSPLGEGAAHEQTASRRSWELPEIGTSSYQD